MKKCDNIKIHISSNFILSTHLLIMFDTLLLSNIKHYSFSLWRIIAWLIMCVPSRSADGLENLYRDMGSYQNSHVLHGVRKLLRVFPERTFDSEVKQWQAYPCVLKVLNISKVKWTVLQYRKGSGGQYKCCAHMCPWACLALRGTGPVMCIEAWV
jgi:hypothetical protein